METLDSRLERLGFHAYYRLVDLSYAAGIATRKRTVAGTYRSHEPTNPHGDDLALAVLAGLPTDATVFDVGAHVGEYAIPLAVGTRRRVVAFEPNPVSADRLARNVRSNVRRDVRRTLRADRRGRNGTDRGSIDDRIDLRRIGVGDENDETTFYRSTFSKCSAFDRAEATRWGARVAGTETVPIRRIDDEDLPAPDAIKVDVEGNELAVLRGAADTIADARPLLVIEVHGTDDADSGDSSDPVEPVRRWLAERDYEVTAHDDVLVCRAR